MTTEQIVPVVYLSVSVVMLAHHARAVIILRRAKAQRVLTRTTGCRVVCSMLYIAVGVNAVTRNWAPATFPLVIYLVTQLIWGANTTLDERLGVPRKRRRRWPITITIGRPPTTETAVVGDRSSLVMIDATPDEGWDQSWGFADPATAAASGRDVVSMYLSHDTSKNVTATDIKAYHRVGIGVILNWESEAGRPLLGGAAGTDDAKAAVSLVNQLIAGVGYSPRSRLAIPFSCDRDVNSSQYPKIDAYYRATKAVLGARFANGVYGEADLCDHLHAAGLTEMEWQTYAWSGGRISAQADFYQYHNSQTLGGAAVDFDRVLHAAAIGAWWPPGHPLDGGDTAPMTPAEIKAIFNTDNILPAPADSASYATNKFWTFQSHIVGITAGVRAIAKIVASLPGRIATLQASVAALDAKVTALQQSGGVTVTPIDIPATLHVGGPQ